MHGRASLWVLVALSWTCVPVQDHPAGDQEDSPAKRSIALVDEDFDVPQVHDVAEYGNAVDDDFPGPWGGSGEKGVETELTEEEPTTMSAETRETVQETAATAPTRNATDRSKTKTRETVQETTATAPTRNATDRSKTKSKTTRSSKATAALLTKNASEPTKDAASGSTDVTITSTETSDSVGGSGDTSVSSEQLTTPDDGFEDDNGPLDYVSELCWNTTCEDADLWVQPEGMALVAEGTNLTLTCRGNLTDHQVLYWYRGSNSTLHEQAFAIDQGLLLNVPDARAFHSGLYRCVRWVGVQICCNREIRITVYEVPSYKYHIIIGALVAAALLLACVWLQVRQTKRYAVYSKEFATKHGKAENLLWK